MEGSEMKLVDYSSSEGEDFAEENIKNGGLKNFGEDYVKYGGTAKLQHTLASDICA